MSSEEENQSISASALGNPELEALKELPASSRRALVQELALMSQESPVVAQAARLLMEALEPGEEEE